MYVRYIAADMQYDEQSIRLAQIPHPDWPAQQCRRIVTFVSPSPFFLSAALSLSARLGSAGVSDTAARADVAHARVMCIIIMREGDNGFASYPDSVPNYGHQLDQRAPAQIRLTPTRFAHIHHPPAWPTADRAPLLPRVWLPPLPLSLSLTA